MARPGTAALIAALLAPLSRLRARRARRPGTGQEQANGRGGVGTLILW
jgi:hypothetical protein